MTFEVNLVARCARCSPPGVSVELTMSVEVPASVRASRLTLRCTRCDEPLEVYSTDSPSA